VLFVHLARGTEQETKQLCVAGGLNPRFSMSAIDVGDRNPGQRAERYQFLLGDSAFFESLGIHPSEWVTGVGKQRRAAMNPWRILTYIPPASASYYLNLL